MIENNFKIIKLINKVSSKPLENKGKINWQFNDGIVKYPKNNLSREISKYKYRLFLIKGMVDKNGNGENKILNRRI